MSISKGRKAYIKARNIKNNNWTDRERRRHPTISAGDGILPKSRKWHEKAEKVSA